MTWRVRLTGGDVVVRTAVRSRRIPLTQIVEAHPSSQGVDISTIDGRFFRAAVPDPAERAALAEAITTAAATASSASQPAVVPPAATATSPASNKAPGRAARIFGYCLGPAVLIGSFLVPGVLTWFRQVAVLLTIATVMAVVGRYRGTRSRQLLEIVGVLPGALADEVLLGDVAEAAGARWAGGDPGG
jgi:hypothetical protein